MRAILDEIAQSALSATEKKGLYRHTIFLHMVGGQHQGGGGEVLDRLEETLVAAGSGTKVRISQAKQILRARGPDGVGLAARLGRLSKARNSRAHPDVTLAAEVHELVSQDEHYDEPKAEVATGYEEGKPTNEIETSPTSSGVNRKLKNKQKF